MASSLDIVVASERLLTHHDREERNRLDGAILASATSLTLEFDAAVSKGTRLGIDWELFEVWANPSGKTYTVDGAQEGTAPASHADNAQVLVNPKFPRQFILDDVNHELDDLSSPMNGLFQVKPKDITVLSGVYGYDLAIDFLGEDGIIDATYERSASSRARRNLLPGEIEAQTGLDTVEFASGSAVFFRGVPAGTVVRVRYKAKFTNITTSTADVATTSGLPTTALDILQIGAAIRQLDPLEPARNYTDAQGSTRRSIEVPAGAAGRSTISLKDSRAKRISAEAARLRARYPMVLR